MLAIVGCYTICKLQTEKKSELFTNADEIWNLTMGS